MISLTKDLPEHFGPMKIRSESATNQNLNLERSQVYSNSIERSVLNITREDDSVEKNKKQTKGGKIRFQQDVEIETLKREVKRLSTLTMQPKQSSLTSDSMKKMAEIKKQFVSFKQNVIQELERQKNLVAKMINDILLCLQFELGRIGKPSDPSDTQSLKFFDVKRDDKNIGNFQQLKKSLNNQVSEKSQNNSKGISEPQSINSKDQSVQNIGKQVVEPQPLVQFDLTNFTEGVERLKAEMGQMGTLI